MLAIAAALSVALAAGGVTAGRAAAAPAPAVSHVEVLAPAWAAPGAALACGVQVRLAAAADRVSVRLRLRDEHDQTLWMRTRTSTGLKPGTYFFPFARPAGDALDAGVYSLEAEVAAGRDEAVDASATLPVADASTTPVPVAVVVRIAAHPARDPSGAFTTDPALDTGPRAEADALAELAMLRPDLELAVSLPAFLLDDWRAAASGYRVATDTPTATVGADAPAAFACRATLDALGRARASGLTVLGGLYAEPDPGWLARRGADPREVAEQVALASQATSDALHAAEASGSLPSTGLAPVGGVLPTRAALSAIGAGTRFFVLDQGAVRSGGRAAAPGVYQLATPGAVRSAAVNALVVDGAASRMLADPARASVLRGHLLAHALAREGGTTPVVLAIEVGADGAHVADVQPALASLARLPWVRMVSVAEAAALRGPKASMAATPALAPGAPAGYWSAVTTAARVARAFETAVGPADPDARRAVLDSMLAASRSWAATSGAWPGAAQGLAYAKAANTAASRVLFSLSVQVPPVTLSGSEGRVPVSITNRSSKTLKVVVTPHSPSTQVRVQKTGIATSLHPGENILSVPVDLGAALAADLAVDIRVDGLELARGGTTVRASYLDRIVMIAAVVLVLLGLLWYIHTKVRPTLARRR